VLFAQQNSTAPQPRAVPLPVVARRSRKFGRPSAPEGMLPKVPDGFTVSVYAGAAGAAPDGLRARTAICS
jgi:hypothetical protein